MTIREHIIFMLNKRIKQDKIISQVSLAKALDVTEGAISKMMKTGQVDIENIIKLSNALKITPNELLGYDEDFEIRDIMDILDSDPKLKEYILSRKN